MAPDETEQQGGDRARPSGRWVPVAQEPDQISAEIIVNFLRLAAIPARTDAGDTMSFLGPSALPTRVLVPVEWEREAVVALERRGHDEQLPPGVRL
jgi:hypothetical protein